MLIAVQREMFRNPLNRNLSRPLGFSVKWSTTGIDGCCGSPHRPGSVVPWIAGVILGDLSPSRPNMLGHLLSGVMPKVQVDSA